jgi:hypothetical protein
MKGNTKDAITKNYVTQEHWDYEQILLTVLGRL